MNITPKENILKVKPYIPGKPIEDVKRELGLKTVIKLASNENPYGPSPKVLRAMAAASRTVNRYPDGACFYLRHELARQLGVEEDQLIFGNGSDEIIVLAVRAYVGKGDEVVIAQPSFLIYEIASLLEGAIVRSVPLRDFRYDLPGMKKAVNANTKIIFIGNPDNPAGTYVPRAQLLEFLSDLRRDIIIFIDEAYFEYVHEKDYPNGIDLLRSYPNVIVTRTFSKMYGLAGLRVGYGVADAKIIDHLNRLREPFNVNSIAQAAAIACLKDKGFYRRIAKAVEEERIFLYKSLKSMNVAYEQSFTNFILINVKTDSSIIAQKLMKRGIIIRDMKAWGLNQYIRVTIGSQKENRLLIKMLNEVLRES
ncbi:MAG: histidinol-phosphate transaminase [Candidatus Omnitrophica bacterium]|nr:histidinol-phosphate transaminase [Candidatus Omnitrophota bacterium]